MTEREILEKFKVWLQKNTTLAASSIDKYAGGVKTISKDMIKCNVVSSNIILMDIIEFNEISKVIFNNDFFISKNYKGKNMYSRSLESFQDFLKYENKEFEITLNRFEQMYKFNPSNKKTQINKNEFELEESDNQTRKQNIDYISNINSAKQASIDSFVNSNDVISESLTSIFTELVGFEQSNPVVTIEKNNNSVAEKRINIPRSSKRLEFIQRQVANFYVGLRGEELVLAYEINRLKSLDMDEYAEKVIHSSEKNPKSGFDILSYDINDEGEIYEFYISVKTTKSKETSPFSISSHELELSKKFGDKYKVYRVCEICSDNPRIIIIDTPLKDCDLSARTYSVSV
ncbi:MAG: DUF3883 domain-containing protein [bacterium]